MDHAPAAAARPASEASRFGRELSVLRSLRWGAILLALATAHGLTEQHVTQPTFDLLVLGALLYNGFVEWHYHQRPGWVPLPGWATLADVAFVLLGCYLSGGVHSDLRYLLLLAPLTSSRRQGMLGALIAGTAGTLGLLLLAALGNEPSAWQDVHVFGSWVMFTSVSVGLLGSQVIHTRAELEARVAQRTEELEAANTRLRELDALKSGFVNAVSHELRTPLTSIMGYTELLEDSVGGELSPVQLEYAHQIQGSAQHLRHIVDDLLDFARLEAGTFRLLLQDLDLGPRVRAAATSLAPLIRQAQLELELSLPETPVQVRMDPERIGQVILNLLANAIKFSPRGGRLRVRLTATPDAARLEIEDQGIGIAAAHLPYLFTKFYQVDPSATREQGGAGLGLAISRSLVEAHAGQIGVMSEQDRGSTFWFTLPRLPAATDG